MQIEASALKRQDQGINEAAIYYALANLVAEVTDQRQPFFVMLIGKFIIGGHLEIGVLDPENDPRVIHAMRLRHNWRRYLPEGE